MSEATRRETQLGLADLTKRLKTAGVPIAEQRIDDFRRRNYFAVGTPKRLADFEVSTNFLDDLPNTAEYRNAVDAYAHAVAGRMKFGSPEAVHSRSGIPVLVEIHWPIAPASDGPACMLTTVTNLTNNEVAKCAVSMISTGGRYINTIFDDLRRNANRVAKGCFGRRVDMLPRLDKWRFSPAFPCGQRAFSCVLLPGDSQTSTLQKTLHFGE